MKNSRKAIFPGFLIGCLILIWLGSIAANRMPALQTPSQQEAIINTNTPTQIVPTSEITPTDLPTEPEQTADMAVETTQTPNAPDQTAIATETALPTEQTFQIDPDCALNPGLPGEVRQWCSLIESFAAEYNLPAGLIAAVIMQESYGDPLAYSKSGAVGLMQVMPRDGLAASFQCPAGPCFADRPTIAELEDPAFNINYGTRLLANLFSIHGSYREALYKYGPINMGYQYADIVLNLWETYP